MFLSVKNSKDIELCLEGSDALLASIYASINEEYGHLEVSLTFDKSNARVHRNLVLFIRELDKMAYGDIESSVSLEESLYGIEDSNQEEGNVEIDDIEESLNDDISEPLDFTESTSIEIEEEPEELIIEESIKEEVIEKKEEIVIPKPTSSSDKLMESIKEQQKNEGLLELEGDKVNTLIYRDQLVMYMRLGFASSLLFKKTKDCKDASEQVRLFAFCEDVKVRIKEFEVEFENVGLTTAQIHTFKMEVVREVKKYQDESIKVIYDYLSKQYTISEGLLQSLK